MSAYSNQLREAGWVFEKDCAVCGRWPKAERAKRRGDGGDYLELPIKGTCARCWAAFWTAICVVVDSQEEMDALREAIREDRRKGNPRPNGHLLLAEIRSKVAKH